MATHKKPNFEDSLFFLNTLMLENQYMSETDPITSMSCILQRFKRIREMLKISFLKKQDLDDQLLFKGIPTLLQTGHSEKDEKTPFSVDPYLFQDCPTFPLTEEDTYWGDYLDNASNISEDSDEDGYTVQRVSNFV
jgi:hypothetical protein